tara:strand:- start:2106 stop:2567 length:462 start_codon:yes stop_codon:yes gene_type:complete
MKISIIPENEDEQLKWGEETVFENVGQFFMFGSREEGESFHEWKGTFAYLLGQMHYFNEVINDERREQSRSTSLPQMPQIPYMPNIPAASDLGIVKQGEVSPIQKVDTSNLRVLADDCFEDEGMEGGDEGVEEDPFDDTPTIQLNAEDIIDKQ